LALLVSKYDAKNPGSIFSGDDWGQKFFW
jgi:hypothetical protein